MVTADYQIVHDIPGRVRLRVPGFRHDPRYTLTVQGLLEAIEPVLDTRVVPVNETLVIQYEHQALSEAGFRQKLTDILSLARDPDFDGPFSVRWPGYHSSGLTLYEFARAREIKHWWSDLPEGLTTAVAEISGTVVKILEPLLPDWAIERALRSIDHLARKAPEALDLWRSKAKVAHPRDPRAVSLEECDRLVEKIRQETLEFSIVEGAISGLLGPVGEIANVPVFVFQALESIHRIGSCYGYSPTTEEERNFAYTILGAALAATPSEKRQAVKNIQESHARFYRQAFGDTLTEFGSKSAVGLMRDPILGQLVVYLAPGAIVGALLIVFAVFFDLNKDFFLDRGVIASARHAYQLRWLLDNGKLSPVTGAEVIQ
ncbi:EcsC family protein [Pannus brasiliensis CCIBt3594]|uniref:EcsC family protein n=1 Tax=Pannus brasiliensis CCIBt3594 TaxID=1427578 RepID=A0AAW9QWN0_9CHRO